MSIIKPDMLNKKGDAGPKKDLDIHGPDLMPVARTDKWPTAQQIYQAQQLGHRIESEHVSKSAYILFL